MGTGPNATNIESSLRYADAGVGFYHEEAIPLFEFKLGTGLTLTGATDPILASVNTTGRVIQWAFDDDASDVIAWQTTLPRTFKSLVDAGDSRTGSLRLRLLLRKVDAAADENADLDMRVQLFAFSAGDTAVTTLTTPVDELLAASSTGANYSSFEWYEFDLGAQLLAESKRVDGGDSLRIVIGPDDTVGSANMTLELAAAVLTYEKHASFPNRTLIDA